MFASNLGFAAGSNKCALRAYTTVGGIAVATADGSDVRNLTRNSFYDYEPDWQPLPAPKRADYKNAEQFCKADRDFLGDGAFRQKYGGGGNAYGKCVSAR